MPALEHLEDQYLATRQATDLWQSAQLNGETVKLEATVPSKEPTPDIPGGTRSNEEIDALLTSQKTRPEKTVESPEVQAIRRQYKEHTSKLFSGEAAVEEVGKAGRKLAEAVAPGIELAGRAIGLDETGAAALSQGMVEFLAGLPGKDESDLHAGFETALAALPMVGMMVKGGKVVGKAVAKEFANAAKKGVEIPVTWEEAIKIDEHQQAFTERLKTFDERLSTQRRGVRSDVQVTADSISSEALQMESFLNLTPGTILKDSDVVAAKRMFKDLAEPTRQLAQWMVANPGDQKAFLALLEQLPKVDQGVTSVVGAYAESGRTQRLLSKDRPTGGMIPADSAERVRISDPYIQQWLAFFKEQDELAAMGAGGVTKERFVGMLASLKSPDDILKFARIASNPTWGDMLAEVYVQSALWGLAPVKNMMGNPGVYVGAVVDRAAAAGISSVRASGRAMLGQGFTRDVYFGEVGALLRATVGSFGDAWRLAWRSFKEERALTQGETVEPMRKAITADALALTGVSGAFVDFLGSAIRLSGRSLLLGDEFAKGIAFNAELRALAIRRSHQETLARGLTGKQASDFYRDSVENVINNPDKFPSIKAAAQEFATYVTLTQELGPLGQSVQTWATTARTASGLPVGRFIMPFTTIATNAPRMAGEHSPLAVFSSMVWDEIRAGGSRRDLALAKIATGTAAMMGFADLASQGIVTGAGPRSKEARQARHDATGWSPISVWTGKEYVSVQSFEPWSTLMGATADLTEMYSHAETVEQRSKIDAAMVAVNYAVSRNITSKTYLMGLSGLLTAAMSGEIDSFQSFMNQLAAGLVPFAGGLRQVTAVNDPVFREAVDMADAVKREIPGWSDTLRPSRNFWTQEVTREGGFGWDFYNPLYVSSGRKDPVSQEFVRLEFFPSMPSKNIEGVPLSETKDGEYDAYVVLSQGKPILGDKTLHQQLAELMQSDLYKHSSDGKDGGKKVLIQSWVSRYRDMARFILSDAERSREYGYDFPDLRSKIQDKRDQQAKQFQAVP